MRRAAEEFQATDRVAAVRPGGGYTRRPSRPESQCRERSACTPCVQAAALRGLGLLPPKAVGGAALIAHALGKCRRKNPVRWSVVLLPPLFPPWTPPPGVQYRPPEGRVGAGPHP